MFGIMPQATRTKKPDVKVVILGDMNVGKTSLLHRYTERKFKDTISTVGGAFFLKQWGPYNISIWDTAGKDMLFSQTGVSIQNDTDTLFLGIQVVLIHTRYTNILGVRRL